MITFVLLTLLAAQPAFSNDFCHIDHALVSIYAVRTDTGEVLIDQKHERPNVNQFWKK